MNILRTKTHVDNLRELRQRKAELKARLAAEQTSLRADWQELRAELRPNQIIAKFVQSLVGGPADQPHAGSPGLMTSLQGPLRMASDMLIGNTRTRLLVNLIAPLLLTYLPRLAQKAKGISIDKSKAKLYGTLRQGIAGLRSQLKRKKTAASQEADNGDIVQPS